MEALNNDIKVNQYINSMKTFAVALTLQFINWITHVLGFITIADVTAVFAMIATGFAALNGLVLLIKNTRKGRDAVREDTNHGDPKDKN
jgi:hypothetical protein